MTGAGFGWWRCPEDLHSGQFADLSDRAQASWVRMMSMSSALRTDGILSARQLKRCNVTASAISELMSKQYLICTEFAHEFQYELVGFLRLQTPAKVRAKNKEDSAERQRNRRMSQRDNQRDTPRDKHRDNQRDIHRDPSVKREESKSLTYSELFSPPSISETCDSPPSRGGEPHTPERDVFWMVSRAYQARYEKHTGDAWQAFNANRQKIREVCAYLAAQTDPQTACDEMLDGFFADPKAGAKRWPWGWLAVDPGRYRAKVADPAALEAQRKAERYAAEMAQAQADHERALAQIARG